MSRFRRPLARATSDYVAAKKARSGTKWTEQDYRDRGIELLHLRLKPEHHEPLDELAALWGVSRGEAAKRSIEEAHARHVAPYAARRGAEQPPDESTEQTIAPEARKPTAGLEDRAPLNMRSGGSKSDNSKKKAT